MEEKIVGMPEYVGIEDGTIIDGKSIKMVKQYLDCSTYIGGVCPSYLSILYIEDTPVGWIRQTPGTSFYWECHIPDVVLGDTKSEDDANYSGWNNSINDAVKALVECSTERAKTILAWKDDAQKIA